MGYNIDTWKTKKLENLTIPLKAFYEHPRKDWHPSQPQIKNIETMEVKLHCGEQSITGILKDNNIHVTKIKITGEGSGTFKGWILDNALKQSKGELEAVLVWESGDSIETFKVKDGVIESTPLEL